MGNLISVIIAAYNAEKTIGSTIFSLLNQTWEEFEIIIVDDASRDKTVEVVQSFSDPRIILLRNKINMKQGLARNIGIGHARGEFIAINDADDLSMPNRLEKQVNFLLQRPEVDLVGTNAYLFNQTGKIIGELSINGRNHQELTERINWKIPLIHPSIMGRATWFRKYPYRHYARSQDRDLFFRSYKNSFYANIPEFLYAYRDPGKICPKKVILASWTNLIMRFRHWREYGLPASSVLIYPLMLGGKWLYWGLLALQGKSLFDLHQQKILRDAKFYQDQAWIFYCLDIHPIS